MNLLAEFKELTAPMLSEINTAFDRTIAVKSGLHRTTLLPRMQVNQAIRSGLALCSSLTIICLAATSVSAKTWECGERSNLPLDGRNYCAAGDFRQSEINLKKVLDALLEKHEVTFGDASSLRNAQSAFESYRDNQCKAENKHIEDEPFHPMIVAQCKTRITNLRIKELKRMQHQDE